jgi:hypothetical protein
MIAFLIITGYLIGLIGFYRFHKWFSIKVEDGEWGWFTVIRGFILSLIWPLGYIVVFISDWINIIDYIENNFPKPPKWL